MKKRLFFSKSKISVHFPMILFFFTRGWADYGSL